MKYKKIRLDSMIWRMADEAGVGRHFEKIGFKNVNEILELRIYDLLNMNHIDSARAEEMVTCLYHLLNEDRLMDDALENREADQLFPFKEWKYAHGGPDRIRVKDIVLAEGMNYEALCKLFDWVVRAFYKSEEYDGRGYRYLNYKNYKYKIKL